MFVQNPLAQKTKNTKFQFFWHHSCSLNSLITQIITEFSFSIFFSINKCFETEREREREKETLESLSESFTVLCRRRDNLWQFQWSHFSLRQWRWVFQWQTNLKLIETVYMCFEYFSCCSLLESSSNNFAKIKILMIFFIYRFAPTLLCLKLKNSNQSPLCLWNFNWAPSSFSWIAGKHTTIFTYLFFGLEEFFPCLFLETAQFILIMTYVTFIWSVFKNQIEKLDFYF